MSLPQTGIAAEHILVLDLQFHESTTSSEQMVRWLERGLRASDSIVNTGVIR